MSETNIPEAASAVEPDQPAAAAPIYAPISITRPGSITMDSSTGRYSLTGWGFHLGGRPDVEDWYDVYAEDIVNAVLQYMAQVMRHGPMRQPKPKR